MATVKPLAGQVRVVARIASKGPAKLGLTLLALFYGWAILEGLLQLVGMLSHNPSLGWVLLPHNPYLALASDTLRPPSLSHLMGTDDLGRDLFSRVLFAAPTDAAISIIVVSGGVAIGGLLGLTAGFFGGGVEEVNMRVTDLFLAFPALILALVIETTLGRDVIFAIVALVAVWWPSYARLFRGEMLRIKSMKFIDAARLSGLSGASIIRRHALRASLNTVVSYVTIDLGNVVLVYSTLSFLGLGAPPPFPEWGSLVAFGLNFFPEYWWYSIFPGAIVAVIVIGASLFGDGVRDYLARES